jgi:hypothetical protein
LGNPTGPLHAPGREWLKLQAGAPVEATPYVCDLQFMAWRDRRNLRDAESGTACLSALLVQNPDNAVALASIAALGAWRSQFLATTQSDLVTEMTEVQSPCHARWRWRHRAACASSSGRWRGSLARCGQPRPGARTLNPANMDALAAWRGCCGWPDRGAGRGGIGRPPGGNPSPPPWYFPTRRPCRSNGSRHDAGAGRGDDGCSAIVGCTAPRADDRPLSQRGDGQSAFQASGIIPRLQMLIRPIRSSPGFARMLLAGILSMR